MLFDPKWQNEVKADPFSLASLIDWLEKQSPSEEYCYTDSGGCLLCRYFSSQGYSDISLDPFGFSHGSSEEDVKYPRVFDVIAVEYPRTFGAALARAREAA